MAGFCSHEIEHSPDATLNRKCHSMRILLVDDHPAFLESLQLLLELDGYSIATSHHAAAALDVLSTGHPVDLVITDYRMPGIDSDEFFQRARQLLGSLVPPFILHSSHQNELANTAAKLPWHANIPKGNAEELRLCLQFLAESGEKSDI